jgi:hypothetical protein
MKHVSAIQKIIARGELREAHDALESLLSLGPNNLEALKLQAMLYHGEGRFLEEAQVWHRVLTVDREDPDAINFILKQQIEDREHYYFTDELPGGGRRYMAYPRNLVTTSMIGLFGCITFLTLSRMSERYPELGHADIMLANFGLLVILPWLGIIFTWFRAVKSVTINSIGIEIATRVRLIKHTWIDLAQVCLAHNLDPENPMLSLVLIPRNSADRPVVIDLNEATSSIRAKSHLIREVAAYSKGMTRKVYDTLGLGDAKLWRF